MGNTNSIPVVSQTKSIVQLVCGDLDGAFRTQETFLKECPGVSQITSAVQLTIGDADGALETQKRCGKAMLNMVDGVPVVGHMKGVVHYAMGDKEGGSRAVKSATRTVGVIAGGAAGFLIGGPVGAVLGGMSGGATVDTATTVVTGQPSGYIAQVENVLQNTNSGNVFDTVFMPVADGFTGYGAGNVVENIPNLAVSRANLAQGSINIREANREPKLRPFPVFLSQISDYVQTKIGSQNRIWLKLCLYVRLINTWGVEVLNTLKMILPLANAFKSALRSACAMEYLNQANQANNLLDQDQHLKGTTPSGNVNSSGSPQVTKTFTVTVMVTSDGGKTDGSSSGRNGDDDPKGTSDKKNPFSEEEEPREEDISTSTTRETINLPRGSQLRK